MLICEDLFRAIIGAAIEVQRHLGPGYLESVYENSLAKELTARNIKFERQEPLARISHGLSTAEVDPGMFEYVAR